MLMFLVILPRNTLQICRFKYSFIGELFDAPDESIEVDSQIIDFVMRVIRSMRAASMADTLVSGWESMAKEFFSDFL